MAKGETLEQLAAREIPTPTERHWFQRGYDTARNEDARKLALFPKLLAACELSLKLIEAAEKQGILPATHYGVGITRESLRAAITEALAQKEEEI